VRPLTLTLTLTRPHTPPPPPPPTPTLTPTRCVPALLEPADCIGPGGPDEHLVTLMLAHLFGRLTQVAQQAPTLALTPLAS
jgi:hypothetical protein